VGIAISRSNDSERILEHRPRLIVAYINLANVEFMRRNFAGALALYERVLALRRSHLGDEHYQVGLVEVNVAETLLALESYENAMVHLMEAERIFAHGSGHERATQAWILTVRGEVLVGQRKFGAAILALERALRLFSGDGSEPTNQALAMWTLARALHASGKDPDRVRSLAERAHAIFVGLGTVAAYDRDTVARFLVRPPRQRRGPLSSAPDGTQINPTATLTPRYRLNKLLTRRYQCRTLRATRPRLPWPRLSTPPLRMVSPSFQMSFRTFLRLTAVAVVTRGHERPDPQVTKALIDPMPRSRTSRPYLHLGSSDPERRHMRLYACTSPLFEPTPPMTTLDTSPRWPSNRINATVCRVAFMR